MDVAGVRGVAPASSTRRPAFSIRPCARIFRNWDSARHRRPAYAAHGDALRAALGEMADALGQWSRASAEIAAAVHASADRYLRSDDAATARFG